MRILILALLITSCTTAGLPEGGRPVETVNRVSATAAWYCGEEMVSFRAVVRTIITGASYLVRPTGLVIPDACQGYNERRREMLEMIEAEEMILREGLI